jgi:hypothetical protein
MSHCLACDALLTNAEAKARSKATHEEIGLCSKCLGEVQSIVRVVVENPEEDELFAEIGEQGSKSLFDYFDEAGPEDMEDQ